MSFGLSRFIFSFYLGNTRYRAAPTSTDSDTHIIQLTRNSNQLLTVLFDLPLASSLLYILPALKQETVARGVL